MELALGAGVALITQLPTLIVLIVAVIIAIARQKKHPQVSTLVTIFAVTEILLIVGGTVLQTVLPVLLRQDGQSISSIGAAFAVIGIGRSLIGAVTLALLLWAAFGWRGDAHENQRLG